MNAVDESLAGLAEREREAGSVAGSVKCISCGTNYTPKGRANGGGGDSPERGHLMGPSRGGHNYHSSNSSVQSVSSQDMYRPGSVSGSLNGSVSGTQSQSQSMSQSLGHSQSSTYTSELYALSDQMNGLTSAEYSRREAEEYLAVIRRQGGLKPLTRQSQPLQTRTNPYLNSGKL